MTAHKTSDEQKLNFWNWNKEIWVFFSRVMVNIVVIDWINKNSNRSVNNNDNQRINTFLSTFTSTAVLHSVLRPCVKWSPFDWRLKIIEILKLSAKKVVAVAYRRWSFTRGPSIRLWLRTFLVFWKGGRTWRFWLTVYCTDLRWHKKKQFFLI